MHEQTRWFPLCAPARAGAPAIAMMITMMMMMTTAGGTAHGAARPLLPLSQASAPAASQASAAAPGEASRQSSTQPSTTTRPASGAARATGTSGAAAMPPNRIPVPLYPGGTPDAAGTTELDIPTLTAYLPATPAPTGTIVIVCPGGAYQHLAVDHEGVQVADWLNSLGVTAFVLKYRLGPRYHHPVMLHDAQRAIRTVRTLAPAMSLRADRVGIMGFSAGGHLAATASTHFDDGDATSADPVERAGSRPDFAILGYPVITLTDPYAHKTSRLRLLGETPDPALIDLLSNEKQVTARTPPTFLFHTDDDPGVPVQNSVLYFAALKQAGVPAEMHIYAHGKHGVGLAQADPVLSTWPGRLADWLRVRELLPPPGEAVRPDVRPR